MQGARSDYSLLLSGSRTDRRDLKDLRQNLGS